MRKQEFLDLVLPIAELVEAKGNDYQNVVTLEQYFPFGDKSYVHMLNTKVLRLISLASKPGEPTFESVKDSVYDLIAYGTFFVKYLNDQTEKQPKAGTIQAAAAAFHPGLTKPYRAEDHA